MMTRSVGKVVGFFFWRQSFKLRSPTLVTHTEMTPDLTMQLSPQPPIPKNAFLSLPMKPYLEKENIIHHVQPLESKALHAHLFTRSRIQFDVTHDISNLLNVLV